MKKIITILAMVAVSATLAMAQNTTRIGSEHKVNFGGYLGHTFNEATVGQSKYTCNYGSLLVDINSEKNNYRTRVSLGWLERTHVCPFIAADAQYLLPIAKTGLYVYPSIGLYGETFHKEFNFGPLASAGLEYQFCNFLGIFAEARYQYLLLNDGISRLGGNAGLKFAFGKTNSAKVAEAAAAAAALEAEARAAAEAARAAAEAEAAAKAKAEAEAKAAAEAAAKAKAEREAAAALQAARNTVEHVYFLIRQSDIRLSEEAKVSHIAEVLNSYPQLKVVITGHADKTTGNSKINMKLSEDRANEVAAMLRSMGISENRISIEFKGDTDNPFGTPEENRVAICVVE